MSKPQEYSHSEMRHHAFGLTNSERPLTICFMLRRKLIRVISARDMKGKERTIYGFQRKH